MTHESVSRTDPSVSWRDRFSANAPFVHAMMIVALCTLTIAIGVHLVGWHDLIERAIEARDAVQDRPWLGAGVVLAWSFVLFLTVMPFGTLTILVAGALLGPWIGWTQYVAILASSAILFEFGSERQKQVAVDKVRSSGRIARALDMARRRGFVTTALLRLAPIVPSAMCALACAGLRMRRVAFYSGTLAVSWVRPMAFGFLGAQADVASLADLKGLL